MSKWFNLDSPIMVALSKVADLIVLSLLWFICCIPIITFVPATAAMYYVALKLVRGEEVKITATFFRGFKMNFKQGVVMSLLFLVLGVVLVLDYFIMSQADTTAGMISSAAFFALGILLLCTMFYTFPIQAQFFNPIFRTLRNAFILSTQKVFNTIVVFVLNVLPVVAAVVLPLGVTVRMLPIFVLLFPGVIAYVCAKRFAKIFDPMIKPEENQPQPTEN